MNGTERGGRKGRLFPLGGPTITEFGLEELEPQRVHLGDEFHLKQRKGSAMGETLFVTPREGEECGRFFPLGGPTWCEMYDMIDTHTQKETFALG